MATFNFSEADGTSLEAIDPKWAGNSTNFVTSAGTLQPDGGSSGYAAYDAWYENGQGNAQKSQAVFKQAVDAACRALTLHATGSQQYICFPATATSLQVRKSGTYLDQVTGLGTNFTTGDHTISFEDNGSGTLTVKVNGTTVLTINDTAAPLTGGYPGISVTGNGTLSDQRIDDWTDGVSSGGGGGGARLLLLGVG